MRDGTTTSTDLSGPLGALIFRLGFAMLGWSFGHDLAYLLTEPVDAAALGAAHGYLDVAMLGGQALVLLGFAVALRGILRVGPLDGWLEATSERWLVATAAGTPTIAFLSLEFGERALAGVPVVPELQLLLVGALVQALVGLLVLGVVRWTLRATERVVVALRRRHAVTVRGSLCVRATGRPERLATRAGVMCAPRRGPPVMSR